MTCSDRSRTHGIRTSALPHFRTSALNYNGLNTLLIRVASFVFAQPSRIVTRIAATGLFALGALAASAMLPVDEARAQTPSVTLSKTSDTTFSLTYANIPPTAGASDTTVDNVVTTLEFPVGTMFMQGTPTDGVAKSTFVVHTANYTITTENMAFYTISADGRNFHTNITRALLVGGVVNNVLNFTIASRDVSPDNFMVTLGSTRLNTGPGLTLATVSPTGAPLPFTVIAGLNYTGITQTDLTFTTGTDIGTETLPAPVGGVTPFADYALTPTLPAGLSFDVSSREITGTPTATLVETPFTLRATDANGATADLTFNITVNAAPPPTFGTETITAQRYTLNEAIGTITLPTATGGIGAITYTLVPNPPASISVSADATMPLVLTGEPTAIFAEAPFTYTATDTNSATATLTFTITISEVTVEPEEVKAEVETVATLVGAVQTGLTAGLVRSRFSVQPSSGVAGAPSGGATTSLTLPDNPRDLADILGGLALEHTADADSGGQYAVWLRGQYTSMDGDPTLNGITVNYDGNSSGIGVGAEKSTGRYVAGVAVNWLATDLDISSSSDDTTLSKYEESLVMVAPYVSLRRGARTFWFSGGYGIGDADATLEEGEGKASADVEVSFASAGADFVLSERGKNRIIGGLSVLGTRKVVDPLNFTAADVVIPKITLNTFRAQGEITYSRTIEAGAGRVVRPYIGVATLHDAGDRVNDDSHAMDLRGGVDFDGTQFDVSLEASTELLREDHESWSVSGSARYQFDPGGRGASLALDGIGGDASDIGLEGGYGMMMRQVHRDALLTPFAGIRHGSESGEFSSGMRLAVGDDMNADLRAARAFGNDEDTLKLNFRQTF